MREVNYDVNKTELYKFIEAKEWDEVLSRLRSNPEEAATWVVRYTENDPDAIMWRLLPLHAACYPEMASVSSEGSEDASVRCGIRAKGRVIDALLKAYPESAEKQDDKLMIPLHHACRNSSPMIVLRSLLHAYPRGINSKDYRARTPLELVEQSKDTLNQGAIVNFLLENKVIARERSY